MTALLFRLQAKPAISFCAPRSRCWYGLIQFDDRGAVAAYGQALDGDCMWLCTPKGFWRLLIMMQSGSCASRSYCFARRHRRADCIDIPTARCWRTLCPLLLSFLALIHRSRRLLARPIWSEQASPALAAAAYLVKEGGLSGPNVVLFEQMEQFGGSLDAHGDPKDGYVMRGGRMFEEKFNCTYDLLSFIPSIADETKSAKDELRKIGST
ncbi:MULTISPECIES: oleate hydratase [Bradyrhizobium]|uniref:Oleate hydratase n=1 Tax=Bradyrhizobium septentrionale TaxID=1404411 RepID=A0ABZ2NWI4_9BRAD